MKCSHFEILELHVKAEGDKVIGIVCVLSVKQTGTILPQSATQWKCVISASHSVSVVTPNDHQVLVEISSGGSCKSQCSVWSCKSEEIHCVSDTADLKMVGSC